jgi:hypothetical protein
MTLPCVLAAEGFYRRRIASRLSVGVSGACSTCGARSTLLSAADACYPPVRSTRQE